VILVHGTKAHVESLRAGVEAVLFTVGLRLNEEKTSVCYIDDGYDFLGFRIQRQVKKGSNKAFVYTWPSRQSQCVYSKFKRCAVGRLVS
jgi:RNA-directed DNA polymerase